MTEVDGIKGVERLVDVPVGDKVPWMGLSMPAVEPCEKTATECQTQRRHLVERCFA